MMSIRDIKESKEIQSCFSTIGGRKGTSERAIEICKKVAKSECPRQAVFAIGRMARLFQLCNADMYWSEKAHMGKTSEYYAILQAAKNEGDFSKAIDAFGDEKR